MTPESQPLVSVLTPVYNGEECLIRCIESVLTQTYQNWDYCIVNNCSTDRTLEIAKSYAQKDTRIRIHNNPKFVGCDENGNIAFQQISPGSKYCKVVFADDWLFPECLMRMVALAEANPTVAIVSAYRLTNTQIMVQALPYERSVIPGREICRTTLLGMPSVFGSPTSMLIHADEVRKRPTFYNVTNPHADMEVCLDILRERDFGFVHQMLTFSHHHADSETGFATRVGTSYLGSIQHLTKYARFYLNAKEYNALMKRRWDRYYKFLASSLFRKKEKWFWEWHRKEMARLGYTLSRARIAKEVLSQLIEQLLNPLNATRGLWRSLVAPRCLWRQ